MKYTGTKPFQLYRETSATKAELVYETLHEDDLRNFMSRRADLGGCVFRNWNAEKGEFVFHKLKRTGVSRAANRANKGRLAFRRK